MTINNKSVFWKNVENLFGSDTIGVYVSEQRVISGTLLLSVAVYDRVG